MSDTLFDVEPVAAPVVEPAVSPGVRRTRRQAADLARGRHPLTGQPLHAQAATADDRDAPGRRCGNCRWRRSTSHHNRAYPKCWFPGSQSAESYETIGPLRATHGEASDVRAWWSACRDHEPGDPHVPDGMRWVPDPAVMR
jgi:hypothetical protein